MGAGASVENPELTPEAAAEAAKAVNKRTEQVISAAESVEKNAGKAADSIAKAAENDVPQAVEGVVAETPEEIALQIEAVLAKIPDEEIAGQAGAMFHAAGPDMTPEEIKSALDVINDSILNDVNEVGSVLLVSVGSALEEAAGMAPSVVAIISDTLIVVGPHLPVIGIAAGALGCLANTYQASRKDDEFVNTFVIWAGGVKDWLLLVAGRVGKSGGENTLALFQKLTDQVGELKKLMDEQSKRSRVTKMLTSGTFNKKFESCKVFVVELKTALKDYLDQEAVDQQEKMLETVLQSNIRVEEKLDEISESVKYLVEKEKDRQANKVAGDIEEQIYAEIQKLVGVDSSAVLTFNNMAEAFKVKFNHNKKIPEEQLRGLRIAIDEEGTGMVTQLQWISFFRAWRESEYQNDLAEYLLYVADNAPSTLFSYDTASAARASKLMGSSFALSEKYKKYAVMGAEAAAMGAEVAVKGAMALGSGAMAAAAVGGNMMASGMSMLGSMSPGKSAQ